MVKAATPPIGAPTRTRCSSTRPTGIRPGSTTPIATRSRWACSALGVVDLLPPDDESSQRQRLPCRGRASHERRFTYEGAEEGLPERTFAVHQAWSGDILTAPAVRGRGGRRSRARSPRRCAIGRRVVPSASSGSTSPRSARAAGTRSRRTRSSTTCCGSTWRSTTSRGTATRCRWRARRARRSPIRRSRGTTPCPPNLRGAIVSEAEFAQGQMLVGFGPSEDARWRAQWSRVVPN